MKSRTKSYRVFQLELDLFSRVELQYRRKAARADNQEQLQLQWLHMLAWAQLVGIAITLTFWASLTYYGHVDEIIHGLKNQESLRSYDYYSIFSNSTIGIHMPADVRKYFAVVPFFYTWAFIVNSGNVFALIMAVLPSERCVRMMSRKKPPATAFRPSSQTGHSLSKLVRNTVRFVSNCMRERKAISLGSDQGDDIQYFTALGDLNYEVLPAPSLKNRRE